MTTFIMQTDHRPAFCSFAYITIYLYDNLMLDEKCVCFDLGSKGNREWGGGGGGVLMQVLNMQCVSDLTGYGRGGM